jgi:hypothetical protein
MLPAMTRSSRSSGGVALLLAGLLSLIVPGSGLVLARRGWLGCAIALLFALSLQMAWWGTWLVPEGLPGWLTSLGWFLAALTWLSGQVLTYRRWRALSSAGVPHQVDRLVADAERALAENKPDEAQLALELALTVDDEDLRVRRLWAEFRRRGGNQASPAAAHPSAAVHNSSADRA